MRYFFGPVAPAEADPDTLQQLSGVNAGVAQTLDTEAPFATIESFLAALETTIAPELAAFAKTDAVSPLRRRCPCEQRQNGWGANRNLPGNHLAREGRVRTEDAMVDRRSLRVEEDREDERVARRPTSVTPISRLDFEEGRLLRLARSHPPARRAGFGEAP